ncbi:MAG: hypothetical protein AB1847_00820 [bacterium]
MMQMADDADDVDDADGDKGQAMIKSRHDKGSEDGKGSENEKG